MLRRVGEVGGYVTIFGTWVYFEYTRCTSYTNKTINGLEDLKHQLRLEISYLKDNLDDNLVKAVSNTLHVESSHLDRDDVIETLSDLTNSEISHPFEDEGWYIDTDAVDRFRRNILPNPKIASLFTSIGSQSIISLPLPAALISHYVSYGNKINTLHGAFVYRNSRIDDAIRHIQARHYMEKSSLWNLLCPYLFCTAFHLSLTALRPLPAVVASPARWSICALVTAACFGVDYLLSAPVSIPESDTLPGLPPYQFTNLFYPKLVPYTTSQDPLTTKGIIYNCLLIPLCAATTFQLMLFRSLRNYTSVPLASLLTIITHTICDADLANTDLHVEETYSTFLMPFFSQMIYAATNRIGLSVAYSVFHESMLMYNHFMQSPTLLEQTDAYRHIIRLSSLLSLLQMVLMFPFNKVEQLLLKYSPLYNTAAELTLHAMIMFHEVNDMNTGGYNARNRLDTMEMMDLSVAVMFAINEFDTTIRDNIMESTMRGTVNDFQDLRFDNDIHAHMSSMYNHQRSMKEVMQFIYGCVLHLEIDELSQVDFLTLHHRLFYWNNLLTKSHAVDVVLDLIDAYYNHIVKSKLEAANDFCRRVGALRMLELEGCEHIDASDMAEYNAALQAHVKAVEERERISFLAVYGLSSRRYGHLLRRASGLKNGNTVVELRNKWEMYLDSDEFRKELSTAGDPVQMFRSSMEDDDF